MKSLVTQSFPIISSPVIKYYWESLALPYSPLGIEEIPLNLVFQDWTTHLPSLFTYEECPNSLIISMVFHWPYSSVAMSLLHQGAEEWTLLQVWAQQCWTETEKFIFIKSSLNIFKQAHHPSIFSTPWPDGTWAHGTTTTVTLFATSTGHKSHENAAPSGALEGTTQQEWRLQKEEQMQQTAATCKIAS